jgi:hypothetical protein
MFSKPFVLYFNVQYFLLPLKNQFFCLQLFLRAVKLQRPPSVPRNSGCYIQVVVVQEYCLQWKRDSKSCHCRQGGRYSEMIVSSGLTVSTYDKRVNLCIFLLFRQMLRGQK